VWLKVYPLEEAFTDLSVNTQLRRCVDSAGGEAVWYRVSGARPDLPLA